MAHCAKLVLGIPCAITSAPSFEIAAGNWSQSTIRDTSIGARAEPVGVADTDAYPGWPCAWMSGASTAVNLHMNGQGTTARAGITSAMDCARWKVPGEHQRCRQALRHWVLGHQTCRPEGETEFSYTCSTLRGIVIPLPKTLYPISVHSNQLLFVALSGELSLVFRMEQGKVQTWEDQHTSGVFPANLARITNSSKQQEGRTVRDESSVASIPSTSDSLSPPSSLTSLDSSATAWKAQNRCPPASAYSPEGEKAFAMCKRRRSLIPSLTVMGGALFLRACLGVRPVVVFPSSLTRSSHDSVALRAHMTDHNSAVAWQSKEHPCDGDGQRDGSYLLHSPLRRLVLKRGTVSPGIFGTVHIQQGAFSMERAAQVGVTVGRRAFGLILFLDFLATDDGSTSENAVNWPSQWP
ncbi:hypothetical protein BKA93DRAFT_752489 [Sparassis latifolia]